MRYTGYELLWLFFAYSFLGWVLETAAAAVRQKKFVNRGVINGPLCIIYGITPVLMSVGLYEVTGLWLFLGSIIYSVSFEWIMKDGGIIRSFVFIWTDISVRLWHWYGAFWAMPA